MKLSIEAGFDLDKGESAIARFRAIEKIVAVLVLDIKIFWEDNLLVRALLWYQYK